MRQEEETVQSGNVQEESTREQEKTVGIAGKRFLTRGVYKSKDVPIRILDSLIIGAVALVVILVVLFAINGGYTVTFDSAGGSEVASQRLRYGAVVQVPEVPEKPGYAFAGWRTSADEALAEEWNFSADKVEGDMTLYAYWEASRVTVKFDMNGGNFGGESQIADKQVVFGEAYGTLPIPSKEGYTFDGWIYSGSRIESSAIVKVNGEHVLTADWRKDGE